jgi:chromosome segregation ATPase
MSDSGGEDHFMSTVNEDSSPVSLGRMEQLLELAEQRGGNDESSSELLKFSQEIAALTTRLSEISREKLQLEFENRALRSSSAPMQIELDAAREEAKFLKSQLAEYWAEVESVSKQKTEMYKERCEIVRKLTDEAAIANSELRAEKHKADLLEAEVERFRNQALSAASELRAKQEGSEVENKALKERLEKQAKFIAALEKEHEVHAALRDRQKGLEKELAEKNLELISAHEAHASAQTEIEGLKAQKEELLQKLVSNKENRRAAATVDLLLGTPSWNFSDLVDSLSSSTKELSVKRAQLDELQRSLEDIREREFKFDSMKVELDASRIKIEELTAYNTQIKERFEAREFEVDELQFEKLRLETELTAAKLRAADFGKQIAGLLHDNESFRNRLGLHAGPGRSNPVLASTPFDSDKKRARRETMYFDLDEMVPHFRNVHDLVEENLELREKVDRLSSECETVAQNELGKLRAQFNKLQAVNTNLTTQLESERVSHERMLGKLEDELRKQQSHSDRLRKSLVGLAEEDKNMADEARLSVSNGDLGILRTELAEARSVVASTVGQLDRVREELKRELEDKSHYMRSSERFKAELDRAVGEAHAVKVRLNSVEIERDSLHAKLEETKTLLGMHTKDKRELEHQIKVLKGMVEANEKAYKQLAHEKESQEASLASVHSRLEKEAAMYQTNAGALRKLYSEELSKNRDNLNFYQTAYEEQVKRCSELGKQVASLEAIVGDLRQERLNTGPDPRVLSAEIERLQAQLAEYETEIGALRSTITDKETELAEFRGVIGLKDSLIKSLEEKIQVSGIQVQELHALVQSKESALKELEGQLSGQGQLQQARLEELGRRTSELEEQLRNERLEKIARDSLFVELNTKVGILESEKLQLEEAIAMGAESAALDQLRSDLQRSRDTLDVLLRENQSLKPVVQERDMLLARVENLSSVEMERNQLREELETVKSSMQDTEDQSNIQQEYALLEKAKSQLTVTVSKLREEASKKAAELQALSDKNAKIETELKHVQEQLVGREKEVARQDGLMKLKDKRILELETEVEEAAKTPPPVQESIIKNALASDEQVKQLMELVNEYQAALAEATLSSNKAAGRQSVYHDAAEGMQE